MDGDNAASSGSTPEPGSTTGAEPPPDPGPGSPTSPPGLETEWFGLAVDSAEQGGLNPHVMQPPPSTPASASAPSSAPAAASSASTPPGPSLAEDLAAYDQLVDLAEGTDAKPLGASPRAPWFRQRIRVIGLGLGLSGVALIVIVLALLSRPSTGGVPAPDAGAPAEPAQQVDAPQPSDGGPQQGVAGGAAQPDQQGDAPQPASDCSVPPGAVSVTVTDTSFETLNDGAWALTWNLAVTNTTDRVLLVVERRQGGFLGGSAQGGAPDPAPTSQWTPGQVVYPGDTLESLSRRTQYPYDSGLAWSYYDRYAVFDADQGCLPLADAAAADPALLEQVAMDAPAQPLGP